MSEFAEVVFHELLHILLQDNVVGWPTPMIRQHSESCLDTQLHLHLLALQRRAHEGLRNDTSWLRDWYGKMGGGYEKAWRVVSDENSYRGLLREIDTEFRKSEPLI